MAKKNQTKKVNKPDRIGLAQKIMKLINPKQSLVGYKKNSKDVEARLIKEINSIAPTLNTGNLKKTYNDLRQNEGRVRLFPEAKKLGWKLSYNKSKTDDLIKYLNDENGTNYLKVMNSKIMRRTPLNLEAVDNRIRGIERYQLVIKVAGRDPYILIMNDQTKPYTDQILTHYREEIELDTIDSDAVREILSKNIYDMYITEIGAEDDVRVVRSGTGMFKYNIIPAEMDLSDLQMYHYNEEEPEYMNCILHVLKLHDVPETKINQLTNHYIGDGKSTIPIQELENIAQLIGRPIIKHQYNKDKTKKDKLIKYGKEFKTNPINIAVYDGHAFIYKERTIYKAWYIRNRSKLAHLEGTAKFAYCKFNERKTDGYPSPNINYLSSLELVRELERNELLAPYVNNRKVRPHALGDVNPSLLYMEDEIREYKHKEKHTELITKPKSAKKMYENDNPVEKGKKRVYKFWDKLDEDIKKEYLAKEKKYRRWYVKVTNGGKDIYKKIVGIVFDVESKVWDKDTRKRCKHDAIAFSACLLEDGEKSETIYTDGKGEKWKTNFGFKIREAFERLIEPYDRNSHEFIAYAHNAAYDFSVIGKYFMKKKLIEQNNTLYEVELMVGRKTIKIRDSMKYINARLEDVPKALGIEGVNKMEAVAYNFYDEKNISKLEEEVKCSDYEKFFESQENKKKFRKIMGYDGKIGWNGKTFKPVERYIDYLKQDVEVLRVSLNKFFELMKEITGLDARLSMTLPSISNEYASSIGCFDGCWEMKGNTRKFVHGSIYGGRTFCNPKHAKQKQNNLADIDENSQYPAAARNEVAPMGKPKLGKSGEQYDYYKNYDHFVVRIRITKINKNDLDMPIVTIRNKKTGRLEYVNEIPDGGHEMTIGKISLEDYIERAGIDFEIIEGVYWDQGFNNGLCELMNHLFRERQKMKDVNNKGGDLLIKLLMNATYGKLIQKQNMEKILFRKLEGNNNYIRENFDQIKKIQTIGKQTKFTVREFDNSYSMNMIGGLILEWSKRSMNKIFNIMQEIGSPVYYTDTDSIHCEKSDVSKIEKIYEERYCKKLMGKGLGQFANDFKMDGCINVFACESMFLAKKVYYDKLQGTNKETGKEEYSIHYRIKSVNTVSMEAESDKWDKDSVKGIIKVYEELAKPLKKDDKGMKFTMNPPGKPAFRRDEIGETYIMEDDTYTKYIKFD